MVEKLLWGGICFEPQHFGREKNLTKAIMNTFTILQKKMLYMLTNILFLMYVFIQGTKI